jgi:hypothetical protein
VPDVPGGGNKVIEVELATVGDRKLRGALRDVGYLEAQITALQVGREGGAWAGAARGKRRGYTTGTAAAAGMGTRMRVPHLHRPRRPHQPPLPPSQIAALKRIGRGSKVLLLDRNGGTAKTVAKELTKQGFRKVYVIDGGFSSWVANKLLVKPVVGAASSNGAAPGLARTISSRSFRRQLSAPKQ